MTAPTIVVIEHETSCPPAHFGRWLLDAGAELDLRRPYLGDELPAVTDVDGWVVLGGSPGATADDVMPWLPEVRSRLLAAGKHHVPALGICLGHQLACVAYGGESVPNPTGQQVGLYPVGWTAAAADDELVGPMVDREAVGGGPLRSVQWNSDIVALPADATLLATTAAGEVQAARFAPTVWGVQFHPEVDVPVLESWADGDRADHLERGIDQATVLAEIDAARAELDDAWRPLAERFVALVRARP